jgi:hypothetical protein
MEFDTILAPNMPDSNLTIEHIQRKYDLFLVDMSPEEALSEVAQRVYPLLGGIEAFEAWLSWREAQENREAEV